jgi:hypothetical protein
MKYLTKTLHYLYRTGLPYLEAFTERIPERFALTFSSLAGKDRCRANNRQDSPLIAIMKNRQRNALGASPLVTPTAVI